MKIVIFVCAFVFLFFHSFGAALSIEGTYQGKNLYIQNSMDDDGFGYCSTKVTVNGDIMSGGLSTSTFEINFANFNVAIGEPVFIIIDHNDGCKPKIINPEVLLPKSTYVVASININSAGKLTWKTTEENGKLPYNIEQFRWNKWVIVGEVQGKGTQGTNSYAFIVAPHSGINTVRITQIDHSGEKRKSKEVKFTSTVPLVTKSPIKVKDVINFSSKGLSTETRYEIYDAYGNIVKKGVGSTVNCTNLLRGAYYINYDNTNEVFIKN